MEKLLIECTDTEYKQDLCRKNTPIEIDPLDIWKEDLFNREKTAQDFSNIINSITEPFVISIDAPYGSGKSFFLKRWEKELEKDNITIFFNAWSCDFIEKPLVPFMYCFLFQLAQKGLIKYNLKQDLEDCQNIIEIIGKKGLSAISQDVVNIDELLKAITQKTYGLKGFSLDNYHEIDGNIKAFKGQISKIIQNVKNEDKNIYVFVDELERCRPTFAVELLESIKHLFDIPGLVFILGTDRSQLKSTISTIYGQKMDGEGYLRRFIDLELTLPEPDKKQFIEMLNKKFDIKIKKSALGSMDEDIKIFKENLNLYSTAYNLSLRDLEHIYTEFNLINKLDSLNLNLYPLLAFLLVLKYKEKKLYKELDERREDADWIIEKFKEDIEPKLKKDFQKYNQYGKPLLNVLVACYERGNARLEDIKRQEKTKRASLYNGQIVDEKELKLLNEKIDILRDGNSFQNNINRNSKINSNEIIKTIKSKLVYSKIDN